MNEDQRTCGIKENILDCLLYCGLLSRQSTSSLYICSRITSVFLHVKKMFMWEITRNLQACVLREVEDGIFKSKKFFT